MSVETDFRALLAADAALVALVGDGIASNAMPQAGSLPFVVFVVEHSPLLGIDGATIADQCSITVQCWALTAEAANAVADAVTLAIAAAPAVRCAGVASRTGAYDPEARADLVALTVEWWA